jgi:hypothetical protein
MGADRMNKDLQNRNNVIDNVGSIDNNLLERDLSSYHVPSNVFASNYLNHAKPFLPKKLVSNENFEDIQSVSRYFPSNVTSFLGFECRLGEKKPRADFAFAISGMGKDRDVFIKLLKDDYLPDDFFTKNEWVNISNFAAAWSNSDSLIHKNVQCFWLEFDLFDKTPETPVPCVFFGPKKSSSSDYDWIVNEALPLLKGGILPEKVVDLFYTSINKIPDNATLFQVGTMLSRASNAVRIHVNKLKPEQIIPFLKDIGYKDDEKKLRSLISDLENKADRFVISFDIRENGIGSKIGIELSFSSNNFEKESRWKILLDYLEEKNLCLKDKKEALLSYQGAEINEEYYDSKMIPITSAADFQYNKKTTNIVRYINHIKIVYRPNEKLEAKAYPAVRLFEPDLSADEQKTRLIKYE